MIVYSGPEQVERFVLITLKHGLRLYAKTGMQPNRAWTITNMLRKAERATGKKYKRTEAMKAVADLEALLNG